MNIYITIKHVSLQVIIVKVKHLENIVCRFAINTVCPDRCATLGTAANMHNASFQHKTFRDLEVVAECTGGVETNSGRAGDPASYYESKAFLKKLIVYLSAVSWYN